MSYVGCMCSPAAVCVSSVVRVRVSPRCFINSNGFKEGMAVVLCGSLLK